MDPVYFEAAQGLAVRVLKQNLPAFRDRLEYAFRICLARPATAQEIESMGAMFARQKVLLESRPKELRALFPYDLDGIDPLEGAAWTAAARVLMNTDEFLHRD